MYLEYQIKNKCNLWYLISKISCRGQSVQKFIYKMLLPIEIKIKKLKYTQKWKAGRSSKGIKLIYTRCKKFFFNKFLNINYSFRKLNILFLASFIFFSQTQKLISVLYLSSGSIVYLVTTTKHELFSFSQFLSYYFFYKLFFFKINFKFIKYWVGLILKFPKNKPISLVELIPLQGSQYIRSSGSYGILLKKDFQTYTSLIKFPSKVRKVFSIYSICSFGAISLFIKKYFKNNRAGFYKNNGYNSLTRGVAMNPIDHPHGGRTKSIKYQRTPWGKTTKYK